MTIAALEIQGEFVTTELTKKQAQALDRKVRAASKKVVTGAEALRNLAETLLDLIEEASRGDIHKGLGTTWTKWFADAVRITPANKEDRKHLAALMSGKGLSQKALGSVFGVTQQQISNDLANQVTTDLSPVTTGLDGKTYTRKNETEPEPDDEPIDAEYEEVDEDEEVEPVTAAPTPAVELVKEFDDETANFCNAVSAMTDIVEAEKWPGARRRVAKANLNDLTEWDGILKTVIDAIMAE